MALVAVNVILKMCQALLCQVLYILIFLIFIATYKIGIFILFTLESRKPRFREKKITKLEPSEARWQLR